MDVVRNRWPEKWRDEQREIGKAMVQGLTKDVQILVDNKTSIQEKIGA